MTIGFILALTFVCIVCRCIIFKKRDIKIIWGILPIVNKYKFGRIVGSKLIGILNAIFQTLVFLAFGFAFGLELWIIKNYSQEVKIPVNGTSSSTIQVYVPEDIANIAIWSKYILIGLAVIAIVMWSIMMWKFTIQQNRNPWWIMLWAIIPVIPYIVFANSSNVVIDGKKYVFKKVEVEEKEESSAPKITMSKRKKKRSRK